MSPRRFRDRARRNRRLDFASVDRRHLELFKRCGDARAGWTAAAAMPAGKVFSDGFSSEPFRTGNEDYEFRRDASISRPSVKPSVKLLRCATPAFEFVVAPASPEPAAARTQALRSGTSSPRPRGRTWRRSVRPSPLSIRSGPLSRRLQLRPILSIQCLTRHRVGCLQPRGLMRRPRPATARPARVAPERVYHGQQNAYRCVPPGRNPGGGPARQSRRGI